MRHRVICVLFALGVLGTTARGSEAARETEASATVYRASDKLVRGITNVVTSPLEFPKRLRRRIHGDNTFRGWSLGTSLGVGYTAVRLVAGIYEILTFPAAAPKNYAPVLEPEYVWQESASP